MPRLPWSFLRKDRIVPGEPCVHAMRTAYRSSVPDTQLPTSARASRVLQDRWVWTSVPCWLFPPTYDSALPCASEHHLSTSGEESAYSALCLQGQTYIPSQ